MTMIRQNMIDTARLVKIQRIQKKWTQKELARRANVPLDFIRRIEIEEVSLGHMAASKLAMALGCEMGDIDKLRRQEKMGHYI